MRKDKVVISDSSTSSLPSPPSLPASSISNTRKLRRQALTSAQGEGGEARPLPLLNNAGGGGGSACCRKVKKEKQVESEEGGGEVTASAHRAHPSARRPQSVHHLYSTAHLSLLLQIMCRGLTLTPSSSLLLPPHPSSSYTALLSIPFFHKPCCYSPICTT